MSVERRGLPYSVGQLALTSVFSLFEGSEGKSQRTGDPSIREGSLCLARRLPHTERPAGGGGRLGAGWQPEPKED